MNNIPDEVIEFWDEDPVDIHTWFNLTYANYLVLHRSILQSMPEEWQHRFVRLLQELDYVVEAAEIEVPEVYMVTCKDPNTGRFIKDPVPHYNRGRTQLF